MTRPTRLPERNSSARARTSSVRSWRVMHCSFSFFSSRRRHTRYCRDWSSDVCSSDLPSRYIKKHTYPLPLCQQFSYLRPLQAGVYECGLGMGTLDAGGLLRHARLERRQRTDMRSEERRVGKEGRTRWSQFHYKKK